MKDSVYSLTFPKALPELQRHIKSATKNVTDDMPEKVWQEWEYHMNIYCVTHGAHIEYL
jgi:hypothetical protein